MSYGRAKGWQTKPKPGCFIDPTHPLSRGLVGCWLFNEGAGSRLTDISGYGNHGTLTNMDPASDWVGSPRGGALDFDGSNDLINVGNSLIGQSYTIASWFSGNSFRSSGDIDHVIFEQTGAPHPSGRTFFGIRYDVNPKLDVFDGGGIGHCLGNTTIAINRWYFGVVTNKNKTVKLYLDAVEDGSFVFLTDPANLGNTIGGEGSTGVNGLFNGVIDDIRIFNRALSADEVKFLYCEPYANILSPVYRRYFIPQGAVGVGGRLSLLGAGR